jgi:hypothetical protein
VYATYILSHVYIKEIKMNNNFIIEPMGKFERLKQYVLDEMWGGHCPECAFHTVSDRVAMCGTFNDRSIQAKFVFNVEEVRRMFGDCDFLKADTNATCTKHIIEIPYHFRDKTCEEEDQEKDERRSRILSEAQLVQDNESDSESEFVFIRNKKKLEPFYYHELIGYFQKSQFKQP